MHFPGGVLLCVVPSSPYFPRKNLEKGAWMLDIRIKTVGVDSVSIILFNRQALAQPHIRPHPPFPVLNIFFRRLSRSIWHTTSYISGVSTMVYPYYADLNTQKSWL